MTEDGDTRNDGKPSQKRLGEIAVTMLHYLRSTWDGLAESDPKENSAASRFSMLRAELGVASYAYFMGAEPVNLRQLTDEEQELLRKVAWTTVLHVFKHQKSSPIDYAYLPTALVDTAGTIGLTLKPDEEARYFVLFLARRAFASAIPKADANGQQKPG